mmetsp:Transcript_70434/g.150868  ORF Transcript_70434/g.150868 Transcript_70434/m.150868 type:complete len:163 (+) Transcript_70434:61-549(+)
MECGSLLWALAVKLSMLSGTRVPVQKVDGVEPVKFSGLTVSLSSASLVSTESAHAPFGLGLEGVHVVEASCAEAMSCPPAVQKEFALEDALEDALELAPEKPIPDWKLAHTTACGVAVICVGGTVCKSLQLLMGGSAGSTTKSLSATSRGLTTALTLVVWMA